MNLRSLWRQYIRPWRKYILVVVGLYILAFLVIGTIGYLLNFSYGDIFSFGQLLMDMLLLPTVVIGFLITTHEFRKSQDLPDLDLTWEVAPGQFDKTLRLEAQSGREQGARPVLVNNGKAVAVWYVVQFDIPKKLISDIGGDTDEWPLVSRWLGHIGNQENWRIDIFEEYFRVIFMSNGKVAAYPFYPLPMGILSLTSTKSQEETQWHNIPYTIASEYGQIHNKEPLVITLHGIS